MAERLMKNLGLFVEDLVSDPMNPPELTLLQGWLGASSEDKHRRLCLNAELSNSLEIPEDAILRTQEVPAHHNALGGVWVWVKIPSGPAHIILWNPSGVPTLLDNLNSSFSNPHILNNGAMFWMKGGSIIRRLGGTATFVQPPGVDSFDAVSQAGRVAGTITVNGVRRGFTSHRGSVTFLDLPNAQPGHFFRPVAVNSCGNNIVGVHQGPNGSIVGGVLFAKQLLTAFQCDTPPVLSL